MYFFVVGGERWTHNGMEDDVRRVHLCERISKKSIRFKIMVVRFLAKYTNFAIDGVLGVIHFLVNEPNFSCACTTKTVLSLTSKRTNGNGQQHLLRLIVFTHVIVISMYPLRSLHTTYVFICSMVNGENTGSPNTVCIPVAVVWMRAYKCWMARVIFSMWMKHMIMWYCRRTTCK